MARKSTRWRTPEVGELSSEGRGRVGVRLGRLRCKARFWQGYGMRVLGLRNDVCYRGKRSSHSQWSQKLDMRKWRQIFWLTLLDLLSSILTSDNEGRGGLGSAHSRMHTDNTATCCPMLSTCPEVLPPAELTTWQLG